MRRAQRIERLLALTSWRMEQDYRRVSAWAGLPLAGAVPAPLGWGGGLVANPTLTL